LALIIVPSASGQHATVVYEAARLSGAKVKGFATIGDLQSLPSILDCKWLGNLHDLATEEIRRGTQFIAACGSNATRRDICNALIAQGAQLQTIVHPTAIVSPSANIATGSVILAGAIVGSRATVGSGVIVNHAAVVGHDCRVGDYTNICSGARLGGSVEVGTGVFVGLNASVIPGVLLGEFATIGAGAVVTRPC
jgi:sugar O-acyltransferase (sialic acid O-acetyltransferase NeuD family)